MSERFDDMVRKHFEELESPVRQDMFDAIRNHPDVSDAMFDAGIKNKLKPAESPVATGLFDKINAGADLANSPFDNFVSQKLAMQQSPVPADMWDRIMQKHRRRPVAWWWVAAGLIVLLSGGIWYALKHTNDDKEAQGKSVYSVKTNGLINNQASPGDVPITKKMTLPATKDTSQAAVSVRQKPSAHEQHTSEMQLSSVGNLSDTGIIEKNITPIFQQRKDRTSFSTALSNKKVISHLTKKRNQVNSTQGDGSDIILNSNRDEEHMYPEVAPATINSFKLSIARQLRNAATLLPGQLLKAKPRLPVIPCPVNDGQGNNGWYADIYTSAFLVRKNISDKTGGKNAKNGFDSTLHRQASFNAGVSLVKNMGNNILLKTGLQYNRTNESFRLTRINERKLVTIISVRMVIIAPGDTVYIRDTSVTEHIGTIQRRKQNTYQQWDVPVIIGYEFGGENIRLNANAGIIANIRSSYSGEMLADTSQNIIDAKNFNGKPVYKTNVGFSLYAGLSIVKPLGERTSLLVEPYVRIGLQNLVTDHAWFRQKNSSAGISVGLRYQLNGGGQRR